MNDQIDTKLLDRAERFLLYFANSDRAYHYHKETMAYAGMAFFMSAFGGALLSDKWPPRWTSCPVLTFCLPILALSVMWFFFLSYLHFQLKNRRWAAIRLAATEHVLTSWSCNSPTSEELKSVTLAEQGQDDSLPRQFIWPSASMPIKLNVVPLQFPKAFADAMVAKAKLGTQAVKHERLLLVLGWSLFLALLLKTFVVLLTNGA